jgi:hypothetical protein
VNNNHRVMMAMVMMVMVAMVNHHNFVGLCLRREGARCPNQHEESN